MPDRAPLRVLVLDAFHGGSHRQFVERWRAHSRHALTVLALPGHHWKWRMRHAAVHFAEQLAARSRERWDMVFCTDMLNLAELVGLAPARVAAPPRVVYFHENQLTFPVARPDARDLHFGFSNFTTCLAADEVWFNSAYHRGEFLAALREFAARMPDFRPTAAVERVAARARVRSPGIDAPAVARVEPRPPGPLRIVWPHRWEYDKGPALLFAALRRLVDRGVEFRVSVIGQTFRSAPPEFAAARTWLSHHVDRWGYQARREDYARALAEADVVLSTADHEFFGIAMLEAVAAGCVPLAPARLAYPETLGPVDGARARFFYDPDGGALELAARLEALADAVARGDALWPLGVAPGELVARYRWPRVAADMDDAIAALVSARASDER
ncbi:MAG: DUF3524 domain-containing protein [Myxococcales bacterium]|nr:DUF3524 domain-containing protein [Myxococcales bacterium]